MFIIHVVGGGYGRPYIGLIFFMAGLCNIAGFLMWLDIHTQRLRAAGVAPKNEHTQQCLPQPCSAKRWCGISVLRLLASLIKRTWGSTPWAGTVLSFTKGVSVSKAQMITHSTFSESRQNVCFEMCFAPKHPRCWVQNTSRIQN